MTMNDDYMGLCEKRMIELDILRSDPGNDITGFSERFWEYVQNTIEKKVIEEFDANRGLEAIPTTEDIGAIGTSLFKHETLRYIIRNYLSPKKRKSIDEEERDSFTEVVSALISLEEEQRIGYYKERIKKRQ